MHGLIRQVFHYFLNMGGFGFVGFGILDSSFLFLPLGNDLLPSCDSAQARIVLVLRSHGDLGIGDRMHDYRCGQPETRGGRHGKAEQSAREGRAETDREARMVGSRDGCLVPPPFPFTVFLIAASGSTNVKVEDA